MNFSPADHLSPACCCGVRTRLFRSFGLWFLVCLFMTLGPTWWLKDGHSASLLSGIVTKMESQLNRDDQHHLSCKVKCVVFILGSNGTLPVIKKNTSVVYLAIHVTEKKFCIYSAWVLVRGCLELRCPKSRHYAVDDKLLQCSEVFWWLGDSRQTQSCEGTWVSLCNGVCEKSQNFMWHLYPLMKIGKVISEVNVLSFVSQSKPSIYYYYFESQMSPHLLEEFLLLSIFDTGN